MKRKYVLVLIIIISFFLILIAFNHRILVFRSLYFKKVSQDLYVSKNTSASKIKQLKLAVEISRSKNARFWKKNYKRVDIYYLDGKILQNSFSTLNDLATFITTPIYSYIVINEKGVNVDIVSHELCHGILYKNLGSFKWYKQKYVIPIWFDEGLALQLDDRYDYNLTNWKHSKTNYFFYLRAINKNESYYNIDSVYNNYMMSKFEVYNWLKYNTIHDFIIEIRNNNDFYRVYKK